MVFFGELVKAFSVALTLLLCGAFSAAVDGKTAASAHDGNVFSVFTLSTSIRSGSVSRWIEFWKEGPERRGA